MNEAVASEKPRPRVLIAASAAWIATAQVPRLMHCAGAEVTFLGPSDAWALRGSYVTRHVAAAGTPSAIARQLERHLAGARYDWVVVGDDHLLAALAELRHEPWVREVLPLEPDDVRAGLLGSKTGFARAMVALGLPAPWARVCAGRAEIAAALREAGGPLMLKQDGLSGGEGCRLIEDEAALARLPDEVLARPLVAQRFVRGPLWSVEALYDRGRLRAALTSQLRIAFPRPLGPSAVRRFVHDARIVALAERIGEATGLDGFGNITVVEDGASGELFVIEIDPRPNAIFHLGDTLGVPMARALGELVRRRPAPATPLHLAPGTDLLVPIYPADVLRCLIERDVRGLLAWATNADGRWRWMPQGDPRMRAAYRGLIVRRWLRHVLPLGVRELLQRVRGVA